MATAPPPSDEGRRGEADWTDKHLDRMFAQIDKRFDKLEEKLDSLNNRIVGGAFAIVVAVVLSNVLAK